MLSCAERMVAMATMCQNSVSDGYHASAHGHDSTAIQAHLAERILHIPVGASALKPKCELVLRAVDVVRVLSACGPSVVGLRALIASLHAT